MKLRIFILIGLISAFGILMAESQTVKNVLVLHSYSPSMEWVDEIDKGINDVIAKEYSLFLELTYEFLDAKRYNSDIYFKHIAETLKFKYKEKDFSAIIACDDHAVNFLKRYREFCFGEKPVFYCCVNRLDDPELEARNDFRGILEDNPLDKNFELIMRLLPDTKQIYVVADSNTYTNQIYRMRIKQEIMANFPQVNITLADNLSFNEIEEKLASLPPETVIFYFSYIVDSQGEYLTHVPVAQRLLRRCNSPVFIMNILYKDFNVIGGYVTDPYFQGKAAAAMATDYLRGLDINDIYSRDYKKNELFPAVFNQQMLEHYKISPDLLPENHIILDQDLVIKTRMKKNFGIIFIALLLLAILVAYLFYINIHKGRQRVEIAKKKAYWDKLVNNLPVIIFEIDGEGRFKYVNLAVTRYTGLKVRNILGKTALEAGFNEAFCQIIKELTTSKDLEADQSDQFILDNPINGNKYNCYLKYLPIVRPETYNSWLGMVIDITPVKKQLNKAEKELNLYKNSMNCLDTGCVLVNFKAYPLKNAHHCEIILYNSAYLSFFGKPPKDAEPLPVFKDPLNNLLLEISPQNPVAGYQAQLIDQSPTFKITATLIKKELIMIQFAEVSEVMQEIDKFRKMNEDLSHELFHLKEKIRSLENVLEEKDTLMINQAYDAVLGDIISKKISDWEETFDNLRLIFHRLTRVSDPSRFSGSNFSDLVAESNRIIENIANYFIVYNNLFSRQEDELVDLNLLVKSIMTFMERELTNKKITFEYNLTHYSPVNDQDSFLVQVLLYIINNAVEAINVADINNGRILIDLSRNEEFAFIRISDNAGGIPEQFHKKIFEPFFTTKLKDKHKGLGLYFCQKIVHDHFNGHIMVENSQEGAVFIIKTQLSMT